MKPSRLLLSALLLSAQAQLVAGDVYHRIRLSDLPEPEETPPGQGRDTFQERQLLGPVMRPYVALDKPEGAEAYVETPRGDPFTSPSLRTSFLAVRAPEGTAVSGRIIFPKPNRSGMTVLPFTLSGAETVSEPKQFFAAKEDHYSDLREGNLPGTAWFRHQAAGAARAQGKDPASPTAARNRGSRRDFELEQTFDLFSGGRAVSENLQLDRLMNIRGEAGAMVDLATLKGVEIKEMDWKPLLKEKSPETDPLAALLPADQHAVFFPSFEAMVRTLDEAQANGTPVLHLLEPKAEDADTQARYQTQLCSGMSEITRLMGPKMISSVAFTGSDPYLRVGSDVAVVFETKQPEVLRAFIGGRQALAQQGNPAVKPVAGETAGVAYTGVVSPDRSVCSYVAVVKGSVVVANSLHQIGAIAAVAAGKKPSLGSLDEYVFFRQRYVRNENGESAFVVLSDATIRRWCSPRWRIADSRRTLAGAALAEMQAASLDSRRKGQPATVDTTRYDRLGLGEVRFDGATAFSEAYGSLAFMTPISELSLDRVTQAEADAYNRWRDGYERNWSQFFDPIAIRFSVSKEKVGAEITVMPLIAGTDYREMIEVTKDVKLKPLAGDPHNAIVHGITAINPKSEPLRSLGMSVSSLMPSLKANPFGWLGESVSFYADEDPFWDRMLKADSEQMFLMDNFQDVPVAVHAEVAKPLELALFLTALRGVVEQTAPGLTTWSTHEHGGKPYVKIAASGAEGDLKKLSVYYVATSKSLIVTVNENVLKRALDRQEARAKPDHKPDPAVRPWLGESIGLQAGPKVVAVAEELSRDSHHLKLQSQSWANLPILNEWKRLFPGEDPQRFHYEQWGVKLLCPGGGTYTWNAEWNTFESSIFGHPGQPADKLPPSALFSFTGVNLGVTFEPNGLSAKAVVERSGK